LKRANGDADCEGRVLCAASVPTDRPSSDHTVRIAPFHPGVNVPLENGVVLWERRGRVNNVDVASARFGAVVPGVPDS